MKKTRIAKMLTAVALSAAMVMTMGGMTAFAAGITGDDESVVNGIKFNKTLQKSDANATTPTVTFGFSIKGASEAQCGTGIRQGVGTPSLVYGTSGENGVPFDKDDTTAEDLTKSVTINFDSVTFPEPGVYRYLIEENALPTNIGTISNDDMARFLDVRVINVGEGEQKEKKIDLVVFRMAKKVDNTYVVDTERAKDGTFVNTYTTYSLNLSKTVKGDMGETDRPFTFNIEFYGGQSGTEFNLVLNDTTKGNLREEKITLGTDGTANAAGAVSLKDGGTVTISGIPSNVKYQINEVNPSYNYKTVEYVINNDTTTEGMSDLHTWGSNDTVFGTGTGNETADPAIGIDVTKSTNTVSFTNTRTTDDIPMTGIILNFAPYILLVAFAGVFAVLFLRKRREEF